MDYTNSTRSRFLFWGLLLLNLSLFFTVALSQTVVYYIEEELNDFWRTSYDILVRPANAISEIERDYGIVEANHLSSIYGGITNEQYEQIVAIPGVELAAPIAMMGYFGGSIGSNEIEFPSDSGIYLGESIISISDGNRVQTIDMTQVYKERSQSFYPYNYFGENSPQYDPEGPFYKQIDRININPPYSSINGFAPVYFLVAAVDPIQEAAIMGLDEIIVAGEYLPKTPLEIVDIREMDPDFEVNPDIAIDERDWLQSKIPILINPSWYADLTLSFKLFEVQLPNGVTTIDQIFELGGSEFLESLPHNLIKSIENEGEEIYAQMVRDLAPHLFGGSSGPRLMFGSNSAVSVPGSLEYRILQKATEINFDGIMLELVLPNNSSRQLGLPVYRSSEDNVDFAATAIWDIKGFYNVNLFRNQNSVNNVPMETYFPPVAILRYDVDGNPIEGGVNLNPSYNPSGYVQSPPAFLTTIEAAQTLLGDNYISAIRVRVEGVDEFSSAAQRKVELIALEIVQQTGLAVDIMIGSSPTRVLVKIPGVGFVEEQWIQKGVTLNYRDGFQEGNKLLLSIMLLAGGVFVFDITWVEALSRRKTIAIQKALGWYSRMVFGQIVGIIFRISVSSSTLGGISAILLIHFFDWEMPAWYFLIGIPVAVIVLAVISSVIPAWKISQKPPIREIRQVGRTEKGKSLFRVNSLWTYAWKELKRHPVRLVLTAINVSVSSAFLVLFINVSLAQKGLLSGTLLGEFMLINIEGLHYAIVGMGFFLAALSTSNGLLTSIQERRGEIGLLAAIGWPPGMIIRLFVISGALMGLLGSIPGAVLTATILIIVYQSISMSLVSALLLGILLPALFGAFASLIPGRIAARIPPAESLNYE